MKTKMKKSKIDILLELGCGLCCLLILTMAYFCTRETEQKEPEVQLPFSWYDWRVGSFNDTVTIADVCGQNDAEEKIYVHLRKIGTGRELWLKVEDVYKLRCRIGCERTTFTVKFSTTDYITNHTSACTCVHNEDGDVLRVDYPQRIFELLDAERDFMITILYRGAIVDTYKFHTIQPLSSVMN